MIHLLDYATWYQYTHIWRSFGVVLVFGLANYNKTKQRFPPPYVDGMANKSSLSSVVSNLVRAQMGGSIPADTLDDELDKRVAELILKEARQKEARYVQTGSYRSQTYVLVYIC